MTEHCDCKVCNSETCNSSHRVQCFCHNISIKIQSSQRDPQETNSKDIKRHKHIYTICYKSIFISEANISNSFTDSYSNVALPSEIIFPS